MDIMYTYFIEKKTIMIWWDGELSATSAAYIMPRAMIRLMDSEQKYDNTHPCIGWSSLLHFGRRVQPCFNMTFQLLVSKLWACPTYQNIQLTIFSTTHQPIACTKPSVGDCFVIGGRLVNTYCELHFRSIQLLPIVLYRNNPILNSKTIISKEYIGE